MPLPDAVGPVPSVSDRAQLLIVDDDQQLGEALRLFFRAHGYYTVAVRSGRAALEVLTRLHVDLVITDMFMPDGDGLELVPALLKSDSRPSVIAMTGRNYSVLHDILRMACGLGAARSLQKPFTMDEMLVAVQELLFAHFREKRSALWRTPVRLLLGDLPNQAAL